MGTGAADVGGREALAEVRRLCFGGRVAANETTCSVADVVAGRFVSSDPQGDGLGAKRNPVALIGILSYRSLREGTSAVSSWFLSEGDTHVRLAFVDDPHLQWQGACLALTSWRFYHPVNGGKGLAVAPYAEVASYKLLRAETGAASASEDYTTTALDAAQRFGARTLAETAADRSGRKAAATGAPVGQPPTKRPRIASPAPLLAQIIAVSPAVAVGSSHFCLVALGEAAEGADMSAYLVLSGNALSWRAKLRVGCCYCLRGLAHSRLGVYAVFSAGSDPKSVLLPPVEVLPSPVCDASAASPAGSSKAAAATEALEEGEQRAEGPASGSAVSSIHAQIAAAGTASDTSEAPNATPAHSARDATTYADGTGAAAAAAKAPAALPGMVSYEGLLTGVSVKGMAGLYELDACDRSKLFTQPYPCSSLGAGLRVGARVRVDNVHPVYLWGELEGFGCCVRSSWRVSSFSESSAAGYRLLVGGCNSRSLSGYAWQYRFRRAMVAKGLASGGGGGDTAAQPRPLAAVFEALAAWVRDAASCEEDSSCVKKRDVYMEFFAHSARDCAVVGREALRRSPAREAARIPWHSSRSTQCPPYRYPKLPSIAEVVKGAAAVALAAVRQSLAALLDDSAASNTNASSVSVSIAAPGARTIVTVRTDLNGCIGGGYETLLAGWLALAPEQATAAAAAPAAAASSARARAVEQRLFFGDRTGWVPMIITGKTSDEDCEHTGRSGTGSCSDVLRPRGASGGFVELCGRNGRRLGARFAAIRSSGDGGSAQFAASETTLLLDPVLLTEAVICSAADGMAAAAAAGASRGGLSSSHATKQPSAAGAADAASISSSTFVLMRHFVVAHVEQIKQQQRTPQAAGAAPSSGANEARKAPCVDDNSSAPTTTEFLTQLDSVRSNGGQPSCGSFGCSASGGAATNGCLCSGNGSSGGGSSSGGSSIGGSSSGSSSGGGSSGGTGGSSGGSCGSTADSGSALSVSDAMVVKLAGSPAGGTNGGHGGGGSSSSGSSSSSNAPRLHPAHASEAVAVEGILLSIEFRERDFPSKSRRRGGSGKAAQGSNVYAALSGGQLCFTVEDLHSPDTIAAYLEPCEATWPVGLIPQRSIVRLSGVCRKLSGNAKSLYLAAAANASPSVRVVGLLGAPLAPGKLHFGEGGSGASGSNDTEDDDVFDGNGELHSASRGAAPIYLLPELVSASSAASGKKSPKRCTLWELHRRGWYVRSQRRVDASIVAIHFAKAYVFCSRCRLAPNFAELQAGYCGGSGSGRVVGGCFAGSSAWNVIWEGSAAIDDGTGTAHLCAENDVVPGLLRLSTADRALVEQAARKEPVIWRHSSALFDLNGGGGGGGAASSASISVPAAATAAAAAGAAVSAARGGSQQTLHRRAHGVLERAGRAAATHRRVEIDVQQLLRRKAGQNGTSDRNSAGNGGHGGAAAPEYPLRTIEVGGRDLDTLSLPQLMVQAVALRETDCTAAAYAALARLRAQSGAGR